MNAQNRLTTALANFANTYRAYQLSRDVHPDNLEAAVNYRTADLVNMVKNMSEEHAVYVINDEAAYLAEAIAKKQTALEV